MNHICQECAALDELDRETELDAMALDDTGVLPYPVLTETGRVVAVNPGGFLMIHETHEV